MNLENIWIKALFLVGAYLLGAVPWGLLIGKFYGKDIRQEGSGNIGATNVKRVIGKNAGNLCFLLDFGKGFLPVALSMRFFAGDPWMPLVAGSLAVLGHVFPIYLKFKGGKGVATGAGMALAISPWGLLVGFVLWAVIFGLTGYVSLASIIGALSLPATHYLLYQWGWNNFYSLQSLGFLLALAILMVVKHKSNIARLLNGTEKGFKRKNHHENKHT